MMIRHEQRALAPSQTGSAAPQNPVRRSNSGAWWLLPALLLLGAPAGCLTPADECQSGQVRCSDNHAESCIYREGANGGSYVWGGKDCGAGSCQMSQGEPFCALGKEPDARCANVPNPDPSSAVNGSFCEDNVAKGCRDGFLVSSVDCTTESSQTSEPPKQPGFCVATQSGAFCAAEATPSPLCAKDKDDGYGRACDGDDLLSCQDGYLIARFPCDSGQTCALSTLAFCAIAPASPEECDPKAPVGSFCKDGAIQECSYGWVVHEEPCPASMTCKPVAPGNPTVGCF